MNATTIARFVLVCAAGLAAATGAQASGSLSIGVTIVSSCVVHGADVYRAAASNMALVPGSGKAMVAACGSDSSYTVTLSPAPKVELAAMSASERPMARQTESANAGDMVMTLTY